MKKILKISGLILLILFAIYIIMGIYKYNIISKQSKAFQEFRNSSNAKYICNDDVIYFRDGVNKIVRKIKNEDGSSGESVSYYMGYNGDRIMAFEANKTFQISTFPDSKNEESKMLILNYKVINLEDTNFSTFTKLMLMWEISKAKISSETYDNKECYKFIFHIDKNNEEIIYIDKKTYLPIYVLSIMGDQKDEYKYKYEVNCVTEAEVQKPNLSEYTQIVH